MSRPFAFALRALLCLSLLVFASAADDTDVSADNETNNAAENETVTSDSAEQGAKSNGTEEVAIATCTTDHRVSEFPIRLIKCNIADLTCFREGKYVFGGEGVSGERRCTGLWTQGPCEKHHWLVVDKARFYITGLVRTVCQPTALCSKGSVKMNFDGRCYSGKEVALNCPKKRGYKIVFNVFGEGECVCAKRRPLPIRYCDTVAVGGSRMRRVTRAAPGWLQVPRVEPPTF